MRARVGLGWIVSMAITSTALASTAPKIPAAGTPGGAWPELPTPAITQLPEEMRISGPPIEGFSTTAAPKEEKIKVEKIEVEGGSPDSKVSMSTVNAMAEKLRIKISQGTGKLTFSQLQQIADFLTLYYRQQGYILTQVYLPPQEIGKDSTVYLRVQEGILEKVVVDGNRIYTQHQLDGIFSKLIGRPVRSQDIESMLLVLNREPGLNIEGIFKPGTHTGQTILVLKVVQSHRADFTVSADNYGSSITGQDRGTFQFALNNMTHHGDLLSLTVMQKFNPTNSLFYSANYSREVLTPFTRAGVEYDSNKYSLGGSLDGLGLGGESRTIRAYLKHNFFLTREDNLSGDIELQHDVGQLDQNGSGLNQDKLTIFEANLAYGVNYFRWRAAGLLEATYDHGFNRFLDSMGTAPDGGMYPSRQGGDGQYAKGGFDEYAVSYTLLQQPGRFNLLKFYISAQYSNDLLTTFSQMALGGQSCFPAYTTSEFLVDSGIWVHGEWLFPVPGLTDRPFFHMDDKWGDVLHLSIFSDAGRGWLNDPSNDDTPRISLADYGMGLNFNVGSHIDFQSIVAKPYPGRPIADNGKHTQFWMGLIVHWEGF